MKREETGEGDKDREDRIEEKTESGVVLGLTVSEEW